MPSIAETVQLLGGMVATHELLARGISRDWIQMAVNYGRILRVRRGWFASLDTPAAAMQARRAGGRLACISALHHYGLVDMEDAAVHIAVPHAASRLPEIVDERRVVIHWYRRDPGGDALAISQNEALAQRARCRALRGVSE